VSIITFVLARVVPSDPAARWVGPRARAEQIAQARAQLGLDQPLYIQYLRYVSSLLKGDWGVSIRTHQPVWEDLKARLSASLELILAGMLLAVLLGIPLGVLSAAWAHRPFDHLARVLALAGVALPAFWLGMLLQIAFAKGLGWLPLAGRIDTIVSLTHPIQPITGFYLVDALLTGNWVTFRSAAAHLVLPALTLAVYPLGLAMRMTRATLLEVLQEDYIRTAHAYGVHPLKVLGRYALRNAIGPVLTVLALTLAYSLTSTFLIEAIFGWPGLGYYAAQAILAADYPAIMGVTLLSALAYILLNLIVDLAQTVLDPRIRLR
jgi:peptide/nickel transport system permease protein